LIWSKRVAPTVEFSTVTEFWPGQIGPTSSVGVAGASCWAKPGNMTTQGVAMVKAAREIATICLFKYIVSFCGKNNTTGLILAELSATFNQVFCSWRLDLVGHGRPRSAESYGVSRTSSISPAPSTS
jgi:hypothetical protein